MCVFSRLLDPVTGQESLSQVLLALLNAVLSGQSQRVTQCLMFKYPLEGLVEEAALQSTSLFSNTCLHLPAMISGLIEWIWIWKEDITCLPVPCNIFDHDLYRMMQLCHQVYMNVTLLDCKYCISSLINVCVITKRFCVRFTVLTYH